MKVKTVTDRLGASGALHLGGRHSRRVDRLRFLLPTGALLLLAMVMAWPWLTGGHHGLIVPVFQSAGDQERDGMRMLKPRYVGTTKAADAYEVTAASAFLDPADPDRIHLSELKATLKRTGTSDLRLRADEGLYLRRHDMVKLDGALELTFGRGYRFKTASARIDLERGQVLGTTPVMGDGPVGTLAADGFTIEDGGKRLRFLGGVQVTVRPGGSAI